MKSTYVTIVKAIKGTNVAKKLGRTETFTIMGPTVAVIFLIAGIIVYFKFRKE